MKKKIILTGLAVALLGSAELINTTVSESDNVVYAAKKTKKKTQKQILREKFDKVVTGDMVNNGEGGMSGDEIKQLFGQPNTTTTDSSTGVQMDTLNWTKGSTMVSIQLMDNKAVGRSITGFEYTRKKTIGLNEFNQLTDGMTYEDVVAKFKEPDSITELSMMGTKSVTASWLTGVKGNAGANIVLTFNDNALASRTQTGLE